MFLGVYLGGGARVKTLDYLTVGISGLALAASAPAVAAAASGTSGQAAAVPAAASVAAFYDTWRTQPIWVRGGANEAAISRLVSILQRAPFDGFAAGPQLAAQVQAAVAQARGGNGEDQAAADRTLSAAWVQYVQAVKRPTQGMIYAFPVLEPQGIRSDQILLTAAAAPSLEAYLTSTSNLNAIYAGLRDAAWAQAQATGYVRCPPRAASCSWIQAPRC